MMLGMADFDLKQFFASWRRGMLILAGSAFLVFAVLTVWYLPTLRVDQVRARLDKPANEYHLANIEDEFRRTLIQSIGGFGLFVGLYLGWRRVRAVEEGQITERFTRAIDQLGHQEMAIRLGGIYALERIARDSEKDHGPIMEVLTAYIRERAPGQEEDTQEADKTPPTDIQAILTVIGRRETTGNNRGNDRLDLTYTQLVRADLAGAKLRRADLAGAKLRGADLYGADLRFATLRGAKLRRADLAGAKLRRADLVEADLVEAILNGADLYGADLYGAKLRGAKFIMGDLRMAKLGEADLEGATLVEANLVGADLVEAENLTAEQVQTAANWRDAYLPASLQSLLTRKDY